MKAWSRLILAAAIFIPVHAMAAGTSTEDCQKLGALKLASTQITSAQLTGSDFTSPGSSLSNPVQVKQSFCRVTGVIAPSIKFELWLPLAASWNGKFQGVGNGAMAGGIMYGAVKTALESGFAAVGSDLGHEGGTNDGSFAIKAPEKVRDWGYRATHEMTVAGKAIAETFYGKAARYAYFTGCSGGGRQALIEAQRYPEDYDGILGGDPTIDFSHLTTGGRLWVELAMYRTADGAGYIPAEKIPTIAAAVAAACDGLDGVRDGVLEDPRQCRFKPVSLKCSGADKNDCLTGPQVEALEKIYAGAKTSGGKQIFPGYSPGGELGEMGWAGYISGKARYEGGQWVYASGFTKGMVFENPEYDPLTFNYDVDVPAMDKKPILGEPFADVINGTNPDLSAFQKRGGKLIAYHGWSDPGVAPQSTVNYYERVAALVSGGSNSPNFAETQQFFRLFMVPGMQHCSGGPGANVFVDDAKVALEKWVEQGKAPEKIVATKYANDKRDQGIERTHPLCPYPQTAHFNGKGTGKDAADFVCK